jgi:hypothetical protein
MRPSQARFVTVCQQLLALAVVLVVLAPAAGIATLDVVDRMPDEPGTVGDARVLLRPAAYGAADEVPEAEVETAPVEPSVVEHQLTTDAPVARRSEPGRSARSTPSALAGGRVLSDAEPVTGYGAVGITWGGDQEVGEDGITVAVRTRTDGGSWSAWDDVEYHDDHAPDPDSAEARRARPGTEPTFVGDVDEVQVRAETPAGAMPADMRLAVVGPGESAGTRTEEPAYGVRSEDAPSTTAAATTDADRPTIFSRAQWGADERLRSGSPSYGTVKGGFVHHTVNANDYTPAQVPGMLRSIYAYHTQSRGWSDVGYNFLVDKFGRIWEGRFGGVTRAVIGAHTLGYNHESFAMSAIGNFETATPPDAMVKAYGALMGWKLGIHGVDAGAARAVIAGRTFPSPINGHRDAGSTACPGRYLYARLGAIRSLAKAAQDGDGGGGEQPPTEPPTTPPVQVSGTPKLDSNLVGTKHPDLAVRRATDNRMLILRTAGGTKFTEPRAVGGTQGLPRTAQVLTSPDLTGDDVPDVVAVDGGRAAIHPGADDGSVGAAVRQARGFAGMSMVVAAGDLDGDGRHDLVGRTDADGRLTAFLGTGRGGFSRQVLGAGWNAYDRVIGVGDVDGDGRDDLLGVDGQGRMFLHRGGSETTGGQRRASIGPRQQVAQGFGGLSGLVGVGDVNRDGRPEVLVRRQGGTAYLRSLEPDLTLGPAYGPLTGFTGLAGLSGGVDVTGDGWPDVLARRAGQVVVVPHKGTTEVMEPMVTNVDLAGANRLMTAGDMNGDGHGDVVVRQGKGVLNLYRGDGQGGFATKVRIGTGFSDVENLRSVGDVTGDDKPDLLGTRAGRALVWPGRGAAELGAPVAAPAALVDYFRPEANAAKSWDWATTVSDLRLVGAPDLVLGDRETTLLWSRNRRNDGTYETRRLLTRWDGAWNLMG